jgi:hypothetical protein
MLMSIRRTVFITLLAIAAGNGMAQEAPPTVPWMEPEVLKAAIDIGMTDEQSAQFRVIVGKFLEQRVEAVAKLMRGHNVTNLDRTVRSRTNALASDMDTQMAAVLSSDQMPKYEIYRDTLIGKLWAP